MNTIQKTIKLLATFALLANLTACPIEKKSPVDPPPPPAPTITEQITALENSGAYPKLDRSADIKGPDQNLNGIRDDIDTWIAAQPFTDVQKRAATLDAQNMQKKLLVDLNDKVAQDAIDNESMLATRCLSAAYLPAYEQSYKISSKIEAMTANTRERTMRYIQYNKARSGSVTSAPTNYTCP